MTLWVHGQTTSLAELANPVASADYALCGDVIVGDPRLLKAKGDELIQRTTNDIDSADTAGESPDQVPCGLIRVIGKIRGSGWRRQVAPARFTTTVTTMRVAAAVVGAPVARGVLEHAYGDGIRFHISTRSIDGDPVPLVDGGLCDWITRLTSNRRLVMVASGMGAQLAAARFRPEGRN